MSATVFGVEVIGFLAACAVFDGEQVLVLVEFYDGPDAVHKRAAAEVAQCDKGTHYISSADVVGDDVCLGGGELVRGGCIGVDTLVEVDVTIGLLQPLEVPR